MGRNWISLPIPHTRIRVGRSMSDAELFGTSQRREALPSWVRFEIRERLQAAAKARGETLAREFCDYKIDKAFALGELDSSGQPIIHAKGGDADELTRQLIDGAAEWGIEVSHEQAMAYAAYAAEAVRKADFRRALPRRIAVIALIGAALIVMGMWWH